MKQDKLAPLVPDHPLQTQPQFQNPITPQRFTSISIMQALQASEG